MADKEIMSKLLHPIHQCQAFLLNDTVVTFRRRKNPTGVRNDVAILFQDNSKTYSTCICVQLERSGGIKKIWVSQDWSLGASGLQCIKGRLTICVPAKWDPLVC